MKEYNSNQFLPCLSFSSSPSWQFISPSRSFSGDKHSPDEHENWRFRHLQLLSSDLSIQCGQPSHFCVLLTHCKLSHLNSSLLQLCPVIKTATREIPFPSKNVNKPFVILTMTTQFRIVRPYAKRYSDPTRKYDGRTSLEIKIGKCA